jgi:phosphoglycolate phosphatase-like HAD superfamily hydrolase
MTKYTSLLRPLSGHLVTLGLVVAGLAGLAQGCSGADGAEGPAGPAGAAGPAGSAGPSGNPGATGATGPAGTAAGPTGTAGPTGPAGADGMPGADGTAGPDGPTGATGDPGAAGDKGDKGDKGDPAAAGPSRLLDANTPLWIETNRQRLNQLITEKGNASAGYDPAHRPVATFDWDNTMMKNDIGDATFFWMLNHDKVLQPAGKDWSKTSKGLTAAALTALNAACDAGAAAGAPLPTSTTPACADELFAIYDGGSTTGGAPAWKSQITLTTNQPYAWAAQLLAGYTAGEIRGFAEAAYDQNSNAPIGAVQTVGTHVDLNGYVRIYEQMRDLVGALQDNGFDVWIVSASAQPLVEVVAAHVGVDAERVIGIRTVFDNGIATSALQGCGMVADGDDSLITFDQGKRCWINKVVFHEPPASQLAANPDPLKRQVFAAGDSDTDIAFVKDATTLKLAINRNKTQLMCSAYDNSMDRWLIQPMFISPKGQKASGYGCSTAKDAAGALITNEQGMPIADQMDTVFALP